MVGHGGTRVAASPKFLHAEERRHPLWEGVCRKGSLGAEQLAKGSLLFSWCPLSQSLSLVSREEEGLQAALSGCILHSHTEHPR